MAQASVGQNFTSEGPNRKGYHKYESVANAAVGEVAEEIGIFDTKHIDVLTLEIAVTAQALDTFEIHGRANSNSGGSYVTLRDTASQYTTPTGIVIDASAVAAVAAGASGWIMIDVRGFESIRIYAASANVAGSGVTIYAGGN